MRRLMSILTAILIAPGLLLTHANAQDEPEVITFSGRVSEARDSGDPSGLVLEEPKPIPLAENAVLLDEDGIEMPSLEALADRVFENRNRIRVLAGFTDQGDIDTLRVLGLDAPEPAQLGDSEKSFTLYFVDTQGRSLQPTPMPFIEVVPTTIDRRGTQIIGEDGLKIALRDLQSGSRVQVTGSWEAERFLAAEIQVLETVKHFNYGGIIVRIDRESSTRGVIYFARNSPEWVDQRADVIVDGDFVGPGLESIIDLLETTDEPVSVELSKRDLYEQNGAWGQVEVKVGRAVAGIQWEGDKVTFQLPADAGEAIRIQGEGQASQIYPRQQVFPVDEFTQYQDWSHEGQELSFDDLTEFMSIQVNGEMASGEVVNAWVGVNEWPEPIEATLTVGWRDQSSERIGLEFGGFTKMILGARFLDYTGTPVDPSRFQDLQWQGQESYVALVTLGSDGSGTEATLVLPGTPPGPNQVVVGNFAGQHRGFWVSPDGRQMNTNGIGGVLTSQTSVVDPDGRPISAGLLDQGIEVRISGLIIQGDVYLDEVVVLSTFTPFDVTARIQHIEPGGKWIGFEEPDPVLVDPDARVIDHFGDPASLGFLAELLQQSELLIRVTMDGQSPDGGPAASLVEAFRPDDTVETGPGQELLLASRIDPWNYPPMIFPAGIRNVQYNAETTILDQNGNQASPEDLEPGMPIRVVGYSVEKERHSEWDPPRSYLAERIEIAGGVAVEFRGTVASVTGDELTFEPPRPMVVTRQTDIREETDFPIDFNTLAQRVTSESGVRVMLGADFWSPGSPQVWWMRIMWPDETPPSNIGPDQMVAVIVSADEDTRTIVPASDPPIEIDGSTQVIDRSGQTLDIEALVPGARVVVLAERRNGSLVAVEIEVEDVPFPIELTAPVDWIDQQNRSIFFRVPQFVTVAQNAEILDVDGQPVSLEQLKQDLFAREQDDRMLLVTQDPDSPTDAPIATHIRILGTEDVVQMDINQFVAIIDDPGYRIGVHDRRIEPAALPPFNVAEDAELTDLAGDPIQLSDVPEGVKVAIVGVEVGGNLIINSLQIVGGQSFTAEAVIGSVDVDARLLGPETDPPVHVDPNAWIGDPEGQRINLGILAEYIQRDPDLILSVKWNPYGPGVAAIELRHRDMIDPGDHEQFLVQADRVTVDQENNQILFEPDPPAAVADDAVITDPDGEPITLADLEVGMRVFVRGEDFGEGPVITHLTVIPTLAGLQVHPQLGDYDNEGVDNDVVIEVVDQDGGLLEMPVRIYLDYHPPLDTRSGHVFYSLSPGPHVVSVELPGQDLFAKERVFITAYGLAFRVDETRPASGDTEVPALTDLAVTFSEPLRQFGEYIAISGALNPAPESGDLRQKMQLGDDGKTLLFQDVQLAETTDYTLSIFSATSKSGVLLGTPTHVHFSTGGVLAQAGGLSGSVSISEDMQFIGRIRLFDLDGKQLIESPLDPAGQFAIAAILQGTYKLSAEVETEDGRSASGFLDRDGDGSPDEVSLAAGESLAGLDMLLELPEPVDPGTGGPNQSVQIAIDLDGRTGNQGQDMLQVLPGTDIRVAVYADGVSDLIGYNISLTYDTTKVAFKSVDESIQGELNLLRSGGGLAVTLAPRAEPGSVDFAGAILGATEQTSVDGEGLLGVFRFGVKRTFSSETEFLVPRVQLESMSGSDELSVLTRGAIRAATSRLLLRVSSDRDTLEADGESSATIKAELKDSDGGSVTEETTIVFQASAGGILSVTEVVTSDGTAETKLSGVSEGKVTVEVIAGSVSEEVTVVVLPPVGTGTVGPMALDLDMGSGDQGKRKTNSTPSAGDEVKVDLVAIEGAGGAAGFEVDLTFDSNQLEFDNFAVTDVFAGGLAISTPDGGTVNIGAALIGTTTSDDAGSMGEITFKVLEGFSGETRVTLTSGKLGFTSGEQVLRIGSGGAVVVIGGAASEGPNPDFDGDGSVGFRDFIQFAQIYGTSDGDEGYDARFDLDSDGTVGFKDFISFAQVYGTSAGAKRALSKALGQAGAGINGAGGFTLSPAIGGARNEVSVTVSLADVRAVTGYGFTVDYDADALVWTGAKALLPSRFRETGDPAIVVARTGRIWVSDLFDESETLSGEADLVQLRFSVVDPSVSSRVEIAHVMVSDGSGRVDRLSGFGSTDVRPIPAIFTLDANYPNPFNPDTTVPYGVPQAGKMELSVYNTLGQRVAVLAEGHREAGYYRAVWDGRDHLGREAASGIYFVRMQAEGFSQVRKMMLLK